MPVLLQGVSERLAVRVGAAEDLQFAAPIIVKPLDAPLTERVAILKNHGWLSHRPKSRGVAFTTANAAPGASSSLDRLWKTLLTFRWIVNKT
jgi:hypothetical protein